MKGWQWFWAFLMAAFINSLYANEAHAQAKGWALYQSTPHGPVCVYCNKNGLAAVNKQLGCTLVTRAPKWNVVLYNDKTKVYYSATLAEWIGQNDMKNQTKSHAKNKGVLPKKAGSGRIAGLKANQYIINNPEAIEEAKSAELWMSADMEVPPQIAQILGKTYGFDLANISGLPLKFSYLKKDGKRSMLINTVKSQAQNIPIASFNYPVSYKRVESELLVFMDDKNKETLDNILNDPASQAELSRLLDGDSSLQMTTTTKKTTRTTYKKTSSSDADLQKYMDLFKGLQR